MPKLAL